MDVSTSTATAGGSAGSAGLTGRSQSVPPGKKKAAECTAEELSQRIILRRKTAGKQTPTINVE